MYFVNEERCDDRNDIRSIIILYFTNEEDLNSSSEIRRNTVKQFRFRTYTMKLTKGARSLQSIG